MFWGLREIVFIATKCRSCPSDAIVNAAATTGIVISCVLGGLVVMIVPLLVLERRRISEVLGRKRTFKAEVANRRVRRGRDLWMPRMIYKIIHGQRGMGMATEGN